MRNAEIDQVCEKYNRRHATAFVRKNAEAKFLGPLGLSLRKAPPKSFGDNKARLLGDEEFQVFAALHFMKYHIKKSSGKKVNRYYDIYRALRNRAISANWFLVHYCVKRYLVPSAPGRSYESKISDGGYKLIACVDCFDPWRGAKFSTYACQAIIRSFYRVETGRVRDINTIPIGDHDVAEKTSDANTDLWSERLHKALNGDVLTDREQEVLKHRFSLDDAGEKKKTLGQVAKIVGVTSERVRQIQCDAIRKLKTHLNCDPVLNS